jgi:RsiW-degrading membrane proteinase PrsW (M82 family)
MLLLLAVVILGLAPGFAWLIFYLNEDTHPEPKRLILFTFTVGIAFAFFTVIVEQLFNGTAAGLQITEFSVISLVGLAAIEEVMKFAAADFAVGKSPLLSDPVDVMIYMIVAALGFATLENIGALTNAVMTGTLAMSGVLETISFRFVGATLLHSLTSGIIGYYWARGLSRKQVNRYLAAGFVVAIALHATFNYLILNFENLAYALVFLAIVGFFVLSDFEKLKVKEAQPLSASNNK